MGRSAGPLVRWSAGPLVRWSALVIALAVAGLGCGDSAGESAAEDLGPDQAQLIFTSFDAELRGTGLPSGCDLVPPDLQRSGEDPIDVVFAGDLLWVLDPRGTLTVVDLPWCC